MQYALVHCGLGHSHHGRGKSHQDQKNSLYDKGDQGEELYINLQ